MVQSLDDLLIGLKLKIVKAGEKFRDESGVAAFVATILLIVIVVALCALFWTNISTWFSEQWTKITESAAPIGNSPQ
jgi:FlaG/FlaF family flagellin (archaellin)